MRWGSQEWWDRDVNGLTETDCQHLSSRLSLQDTQFRQPVSILAVETSNPVADIKAEVGNFYKNNF